MPDLEAIDDASSERENRRAPASGASLVALKHCPSPAPAPLPPGEAGGVTGRHAQLLVQAQALAHLGSWDWDLTADTLIWSDELYRIFGVDPATYSPNRENLLECIHEDDVDRVRSIIEQRMTTGASLPYVARIRRPDGTIRWIESVAVASKTGDEITGLVGSVQDVTERETALEGLLDSERRYRSIVETAHEGVWLIDAGGHTTFVNQKLAEMFRCSIEDMLGRSVFDFIHPEDQQVTEGILERRRLGFVEQLDRRFMRTDGTELWALLNASPLEDEDGTYLGALAMVNDITERHRAEVELRDSRSRLAEAQRLTHVGDWTFDLVTEEVTWSDEEHRILGYEPGTIEPSLERFLDVIHPEDREDIELFVARAMGGPNPISTETRIVTADGELRWLALRVKPLFDDDGRTVALHGTSQDITDRKAAEERLSHLALHDPLTGLPNRKLLTDRLQHALEQASREGSTAAVLFFDLDRFKLINDSGGHAVGDAVLQAVAKRLLKATRSGDTVARFGGDEFVVICERLTGAEEALAIAERAIRAFEPPLVLHQRELFVSASVGIALAEPDDGAGSLLSAADAAMYRAKEDGGGKTAFFDKSLRDRADRRLVTETALRRAVEAGQFRLVYHPIVSLADGVIVGAEALVRWDHPEEGTVGPGDFIALAEETGLIVPLGTWVIEDACRQLAGWLRDDPSLSISVNVSPRQLAIPGFESVVAEALKNSGVDPSRLILEITEGMLMGDVEFYVDTLTLLKETGVRIAIDDFGTGFSSLAYLQSFPVDALKIDQAFVKRLSRDRLQESLVKPIVDIAGALRLDPVAEGIEKEEQLVCLREIGCTYGQGYLFSKPLTPEDFKALLTSGTRWT